MRYFPFKMFEDTDPDIIQKLDSLSCRQRSEEIRKALRAYFRGQSGAGNMILHPIPETTLKSKPGDSGLNF